jgi:uncharacterized radical SAM protein YgiQ
MFDIIFVVGEPFFDHPLCGTAILKRLLEREGYSVGLIETPKDESAITSLGKPRLFFGVSSGSIDSMLRNYTPLKKRREDAGEVPDRAVIVYCNWIRHQFKDSIIVLGGTEATLRRFSHYDYWDNALRKPILMDSRADILAFGSSEKQLLEVARRIDQGKPLKGIEGTCIISKGLPAGFTEMPSHDSILKSKERFCDLQNMLSNRKNLAQRVDNRYVLQFRSPRYTSRDLDDYYELPFARKVPKSLRGFEFSVVTHRGCNANCNFCSLTLTQGDRIISRSEESILGEIEKITKLEYFKGNIDDLGGPSANMYGMDCPRAYDCEKYCLECDRLDKSNKRLINLLRRAREVKGVKNVYLRSGVRFDLASAEYIKEIALHHVYDTLRIAPEHVNTEILKLMNKEKGDVAAFVSLFTEANRGKEISYYFMVCHPGSRIKDSVELASQLRHLKNVNVQLFTPTPMTVSTCMYYTGLDPKTRQKVYVPYTYGEKKKQKRIAMAALENQNKYKAK